MILTATDAFRIDSSTFPDIKITAVSAASALSTQVGGTHYKDLAIQPVEYIHKNGVGYFEGNVIKYVSRWRAKGGLADLNKAKHYLEMLIEFETADQHV